MFDEKLDIDDVTFENRDRAEEVYRQLKESDTWDEDCCIISLALQEAEDRGRSESKAAHAELRAAASRIDAHCEWEPGRYRTDGMGDMLRDLRAALKRGGE